MGNIGQQKTTGTINDLIEQYCGESPRERLDYINGGFLGSLDAFDIDEISWISDRIGITDLVGAFVASDAGHFIINTAEEIDSPSDFKEPVDHRGGPLALRTTLDRIAGEIHNVLENTMDKVVVHCYMGMERSVLSVVWYLHKYEGKTIDEAYRMIENIRPIAIDRRSWIEA